MAKHLQHYLISFPVPGGYVHGYVLTRNDRVPPQVAERLMWVVEELGFMSRMPIILQTRLSADRKAIEEVREVITNYERKFDRPPVEYPETFKDFYLKAWTMTGDDPDTERLMALH